MLTYPLIILGAGASGLFCAGRVSTPKLIIDHNKLPGVKVGVSGGGKCNFTNSYLTAADYVSTRPHFCKNALAAFKPNDFISLLDRGKIPYEERANGQLFAKNAQDIVQLLVRQAKAAHTDFALQTQILALTQNADGFCVRTSAGLVQTQRVVMALGGLSYPALGASSLGLQLARQLGLPMITPRPALCGLSFPKELRLKYKILAGNSLLASVQIEKHTFADQLLFTHEGISGPAVLSASLYWKEGDKVKINFLPNIDLTNWIAQHKQENKKMSSLLGLPGHIAQTLLGRYDQPLSNASKQDLLGAIRQLTAFEFVPCATAGYTKAEVTVGGIDTQAINPSTFEVKAIPGLYIIGELLDVTGRLGGFNLHWAWASAATAAHHLAKNTHAI